MDTTPKAFDHEAREMALVRHRLDSSPRARQEAVATFPLVVANVANDMRKLLNMPIDTPESREVLLYYEDIIRSEYRKRFGRELGQ